MSFYSFEAVFVRVPLAPKAKVMGGLMEKTWQGRSDAHQVAVKSTTTRPPAEARHSSKSSLQKFRPPSHQVTLFLGSWFGKPKQAPSNTHFDTCADIRVKSKVRWHSGIVLLKKWDISWESRAMSRISKQNPGLTRA
jgi:hypothetical protein